MDQNNDFPVFSGTITEIYLATPWGIHEILRVLVCAAHIAGVFGSKFSKQGSLFGRFSINIGGLSRNWRKIARNGPWGHFPPNFIIKVGMTATFGN